MQRISDSYKKDIAIDQAIQKYGKENFLFEIIEECNLEDLNEKEKYYIEFYNTLEKGYNCREGGSDQIGEKNNNTKLVNKDVIKIRKSYAAHKRSKEVYEEYKDKITYNAFMEIWAGKTWKHILPEVYTEENKNFYKTQSTNGELSPYAIFTNEEVIQLRKRYVNETAREIYQDYKDRCTYQTIQKILCGNSYKDLPIYKKKTKEWINI